MTKKSTRVKKIVLGIVAGFVLLAGAIIFIFTYEGSTKQILSVADQFQPGESWELVSDRVNGPAVFCLYACPSLDKKWQRPASNLSKQDIVEYLDRAGWSVSTSWLSRCDDVFLRQRGQTICTLEGSTNSNFQFRLHIEIKDGVEWLSLYVRDLA